MLTLAVEAAELRRVVDDLCVLLTKVPDDGWEAPAVGSVWTCRQTAGHLLGTLIVYSLRLSGDERALLTAQEALRTPDTGPDGPLLAFYPDPRTGTVGIVNALAAMGLQLAVAIAEAPADRRGSHPSGTSDRTGFAAMGITECVLHGNEILAAHGLRYEPDATAVSRTLGRIFPHAKRSHDPWQDLLAATGRTAETKGSDWRWYSSLPGEPGAWGT